MFVGELLLIVTAIAARLGGGALRAKCELKLPLRLLSGLLAAGGAWLWAAAAGAWSPCWPAVTLGLIAGLADRPRWRPALPITADGLVVLLAGLLSIPALTPLRLSLAAVLSIGAGVAADRLAGRLSPRVHRVIVAIPLVAFAAVVVLKVDDLGKFVGPYGSRTYDLGATVAQWGERVVLSTGAVAVYERPAGRGPFPGAVFFHGAHPDGVRQAAACVLRRALLQAGFAVLSVNHPHFGESPGPAITADIESWDPLPTARAALAALRARPEIADIVLVGHSLGGADVFRLLVDGADVAGAIVAGAGVGDITPVEDYWYDLFHTSRALRERVPRDQWRRINDRYYMPGSQIPHIPPGRYPTLFVYLGNEGEYVRPFRDAIYAALPPPKRAWTLDAATHNLSAIGDVGLVLGDTGVTRTLADELRRVAGELPRVPRTTPTSNPTSIPATP